MLHRRSVKTFLEGVSAGKTEAAHKSGSLVFSQDDRCDAIFYLKSGKVKLTVVSEQGKEAVVALVNAGDFFGEGCLAGQTVRMATAEAIADSEIVKIEKLAMVKALEARFVCQFAGDVVRQRDLVQPIQIAGEIGFGRIKGMVRVKGID